MQLHVPVMALVMNIDQMMPGRCSNPCSIKANAPIAIRRNAGTEMPLVLRVRMVVIACGRKPSIRPMLATYPQMVYKKLCSIVIWELVSLSITMEQTKGLYLLFLLFINRRCHAVTEEIEIFGISLRFARPSCQEGQYFSISFL